MQPESTNCAIIVCGLLAINKYSIRSTVKKKQNKKLFDIPVVCNVILSYLYPFPTNSSNFHTDNIGHFHCLLKLTPDTS